MYAYVEEETATKRDATATKHDVTADRDKQTRVVQVQSPQFWDAVWVYGVRFADEREGGVVVEQVCGG